VCQGRPYLPGRLQRYPNVATSSGPYRAVHSYRAPQTPRPSHFPRSPYSPAASRRATSASESAAACCAVSIACCELSSSALNASISLLIIKKYNCRRHYKIHLFECPDQSCSTEPPLSRPLEVVTATRHVHTDAFFPTMTPPPKPYAVLGCCRRQQQQQQQQQRQPGDRRWSSEQGPRAEDDGLGFFFRLRWGLGARGAGRSEGGPLFARTGAPQDKEYIVQVSTSELPTSGKNSRRRSSSSSGRRGGDNSSINRCWASTKKARASSPTASGGGGATTADGVVRCHDPLSDKVPTDGTPECCMGEGRGGYRGNESGENREWGAWMTICNTPKTRARVELSNSTASPSPPSLPLGLRYRVGVRRRHAAHRVTFSEALEMPSALLRRLYDIEELSAERQPLPTASAQRKTMAGGGQQPSVRRPRGGAADQEDRPGRDEAIKFLKAVGTAGDEESFPARLAWELQSQLWPQQVEVTRTPALAETEARMKSEAESIQCTLWFPVNTTVIVGEMQ
ncbi:unnamed protein product, partial [Pylaiella littoralis]